MEVLLGGSPVKSKRRFKKKKRNTRFFRNVQPSIRNHPNLLLIVVGDVQNFAVFLNERL